MEIANGAQTEVIATEPVQQTSFLSPYIGFNGKCKEAMTFYQDCLGGETTFLAWKDTPMADSCPNGAENMMMHAMLKSGNLVLMGSDMTPPGGHVQGNSMSVCVSCSSLEEIHNYFEKFSEGATVLDPLGEKFWGGTFGVLMDKFGIVWMFEYSPLC